jgi:mono/diheme cytochrome c family protein
MRIVINNVRTALAKAILALGFGALALAGGCAGRLRAPTPADALLADTRWPGTTVADLQQGQRKYAEHCMGCHELYRPEAYPASRWEGFVQEMVGKAKLQPDDVRDIVRYLTVTAQALGPRPIAPRAVATSGH